MKLPFTLSIYISRQFMIGIAIVFSLLAGLILLFDLIEIIRRSYNHHVSMTTMLEMAVLRLPHMAQEMLPFSILLGGILTFARLTRTSELVVTRAAGISVWQFLTPAIAVSLLLGTFAVTIFNPLAATMYSRYEQLESQYFRGNASMLEIFPSGLWLRQKSIQVQGDSKGKTIIHALHATQETMELEEVIVFIFGDKNQFLRRIDARSASLQEGYWAIKDAIITAPDMLALRKAEYRLPTDLVVEQIQDSFASPKTLSFWQLPEFIETLKSAGFSALRHSLHWHTILVSPLLLCAMVFIAAVFSLSPPRQGRTGILMTAGIVVGFLIYYVSGLISAMGLAGTIPIIMAAWAPVGISILVGVVLMLHLEDG